MAIAKSYAGIKRRYLFPLAVLSPLIVLYILFVYYPLGYSIWASLHLWVIENPLKSTFIGLRNYIELFTDYPRFTKSLSNTFIYVGVKTALVIPLGLLFAALLAHLRRGQRFYIFAVFLPALCTPAAVGVLFSYLFQTRFGLINQILQTIFLQPQPFLSSPKQALYCVIAVDSWAFVGLTTLIFYAGLLNIPEVFVEAAKVDGAGRFRTFFAIKVPLLGHSILFLSIYTIINAFQTFDFLFVMTSTGSTGGSAGGPGISSYVMSLLVYNEGMLRAQVDRASAVATIMLIFVLLFTILQFKVLRPKWEY
jgi:ABC-type sugar transport system permease subunit